MSTLVLHSVLRCPVCGHAETLAMPTDACLFFHECGGCHALLRPKPGDCCVLCSYGSVPCPPIQAGGTCGEGGAERPGVTPGATDCCAGARPPGGDA